MTIASDILATVSQMKKDGSFEQGMSLCWNPADLEILAMFAIDAKNQLERGNKMLMNNEAAATTPPTSLSEYNRRFALNHEITGFGIAGVEQHMPCPFCAARDFMVHKILETEPAMAAGAVCQECGRGAKAIFSPIPGGTRFEMVQTSGPDQPDWLEPKMRRE
jgi:hypothetical protein